MRKIACSLLTLLVLALPSRAQSVTVPAEVKADPGFIVIKATAVDADALRWFSVGAPQLAPQPDFWPQPPLGTFASLTFTQGVYRLGVIPAKAGKDGKAAIGDPQFVTVTVGTPAPPPPPGPTPGPAPADPFFPLLQAAYTQEAGATKAGDVQQLTAFFDGAARITVNDPTLTTVGAFQSKFKNAVDSQVAATALPKVRAVIGTNLASVLPVRPAAVLDAPTRALIAQHYARIAADLEALK